ncbi:MAG TPA: DUF4097 family beta strand repeat-containing protein [Gemmatimonadaceae bacterium]|nr:DUF4097 family beta strand repeat-containing protein [Gemmatimonadaceae bacterium]
MHRLPRVSQLALLTALVCFPRLASAQQSRADRWLDDCRHDGDRDDARVCETRNVTLPATRSVEVDGRQNGGITVHGWDKSQIQVIAMVQAQAESDADARDIAKQITVSTENGQIRADGPRVYGRHSSWAVSYEVWVPRGTDLRLEARNGGISVDSVDSHIDMQTTNGGIHVAGVAGDVRGTTTNGGVTADLSGDRWNGAGLDLRTTNGGVRLALPASYNARLETGTVNGGLDIEFPITVQGSIRRELTTQLGSGGASIRAMTTNGGVTIRRKGT